MSLPDIPAQSFRVQNGNTTLLVAQDKVRELRLAVHAHLDDDRRGEILRSGIRLAIFGPPNAGKSSLLNFLCKRTVICALTANRKADEYGPS